MTTLLVDIGNSRVKWARCSGGVLGEQQAAAHAGWSSGEWHAALFAGASVERVLAASVAGGASLAALDEAARRATGRGIERLVTQRAAAGVVNGYADPELLGVDRWLAVVGAYRRVRGACVVADIGTAATVDVIRGDGRHCGGYIVPGPWLMASVLFDRTSDLRSFTESSPVGAARGFADNTRDAIERGCRLALAAWVDRCVREASDTLGERPRLVLSGGALPELRTFLETPGEELPDLVLRGMAAVAGLVDD